MNCRDSIRLSLPRRWGAGAGPGPGMSRLLFVASEAFPLIKTGGLADIAGTLPEVLPSRVDDACCCPPTGIS